MPSIRLARAEDLSVLPSVERSAAILYKSVGLPWLAYGKTMDYAELVICFEHNNIWVAADDDDKPVAFLAAKSLDESLFIAELSVASPFQRKGLGKKLINAASEIAYMEKYSSMSLTTYRNIVWNAPFYRTLGFVEVDVARAGPGHIQQFNDEIRAGHDPLHRCTMMKRLS